MLGLLLRWVLPLLLMVWYLFFFAGGAISRPFIQQLTGAYAEAQQPFYEGSWFLRDVELEPTYKAKNQISGQLILPRHLILHSLFGPSYYIGKLGNYWFKGQGTYKSGDLILTSYGPVLIGGKSFPIVLDLAGIAWKPGAAVRVPLLVFDIYDQGLTQKVGQMRFERIGRSLSDGSAFASCYKGGWKTKLRFDNPSLVTPGEPYSVPKSFTLYYVDIDHTWWHHDVVVGHWGSLRFTGSYFRDVSGARTDSYGNVFTLISKNEIKGLGELKDVMLEMTSSVCSKSIDFAVWDLNSSPPTVVGQLQMHR